MEIIKKKISLENGISRNGDTTYGLMTASSFNFKVMLIQNMDDMGMFTDIDYVDEVPDYSILINKLTTNAFNFPFMSGATPPSLVLTGFTHCLRYDDADVSDWYGTGPQITANTESRLINLKSYNKDFRYIPNFNIEDESYLNYDNQLINGVSRVIEVISGITGTTTYVFDANDDVTIGTPTQTSGLRFVEDTGKWGIKSKTNFFEDEDIPFGVNLFYNSEGWNETNTSLSALTKEEYLMGITNTPEVSSDVFIDRGVTTIMEKHLKLSEVESLEHLQWFGNGFYNINKI